MHSKRLRVVVMGIMGRTPVAGVIWQVLHYVEGFRRLGCDVYYVEDTGDWPYDADLQTVTRNAGYTVRLLKSMMEWVRLPNRFAYRSGADGELFGMSLSDFSRLFREADMLVNVTGSTWLREEHLRVPVRVYLETDPVLPQIQVALGDSETIAWLSAHTHHFTFGENVGKPDCPIPVGRFNYRPTRQPIVTDWWPAVGNEPVRPCFTTVASWASRGKDIEWKGEMYFWSKEREFRRFLELPGHTDQALLLALAYGNDDNVSRLLESHGWQVMDGLALSKDIRPYREFIQRSRGEFTVAKDQYIRLLTGWFSDRSACYLAAGRPVVTQNTAFDRILPTGNGLFSFQTIEDIVAAFDAINGSYERHCQAAIDIANEYFRAEKVLADLLAKVQS